MKMKKTAAFLLALTAAAAAMTMPVSAAEVFGDIDGDGDVDASDAAWILQYAAYTGAGGKLGLQGFVNGDQEVTDPENTLTIMTIGDADLNRMVEFYQEAYPDANIVVKALNDYNGTGAGPADFNALLLSDEDIDLYMVDASNARYYTDDDTLSMPLSELGLTEADYVNAYPYALEQGKNTNGELRCAAWNVAPGGYCYNTAIAEEYLGIATPEEMQAHISDWDGFTATAADLYTASQGSITMSATLNGIFYAYTAETTQPWRNGDLLLTDKAEGFFTLAKTLTDSGYVDSSIAAWSQEWYNTGRNGSTMGYFFPTWIVAEGSHLSQEISDNGDWAITAGPQKFYWGGSVFCASPKCNTKAEAERFLRYFTVNTDSMQTFAEQNDYMVNNQAAMENIIAAGSHSNPVLGGQDEFAVLHETAKNMDVTAENTFAYDSNLAEICFQTFRNNMDLTVPEITAKFEEAVLSELGIPTAE